MRKKAFQAAFPYTIPIFAGFWFLALAYGIYMNANGFPFVYPMLMSLLIYGGSLEFVAVEMLLSPFAPMQVFIMALLIQARHIFYGISMLDRFKGMGWKKFYLIFGMCDETFSVNYTADIPEDVDRGWFMFFATLLNQLYWVSGATVGGLVWSLLRFDTTGISFVMTAMFVVIFLEQWLKEDNHISSLVGVAASPGFVQYIGKYLPSAVFGMLVVYCLKNADVLEGNHGLPELIAILVTGALHVWKRQMLLSIAGGTVCYMITDAYAGSYTVAEDGVTVTIKGLTNVDTTSQYTIPGLWSYIAMVKQQNVKLAHRKYIG